MKSRVLSALGRVFTKQILSPALGTVALALNMTGAAGADSFWTENPMHTARLNHTATLLRNGKVLVAGGQGEHLTVLDSAELYDPFNGTWTVASPMHHARTMHTATLLSDGRVLVAGGVRYSRQAGILYTYVMLPARAELYDPAADKWMETGAPNMTSDSQAATLLPNGNVLMVGADPGSGVRPLGNGRLEQHPAEQLGSSDEGEPSSAEIYDPAAGNWSMSGAMAVPRTDHTATLLPDGKVFVFGGGRKDARVGAVPALHGKEFVFGGTPDGFADAELYDPASRKWTHIVNEQVVERVGHTATLLPDGKVLIAGGAHYDPLSSTALYNPGDASRKP